MTLPASYFSYPFRRPGMDHDRYSYSNLFQRKPMHWPGGARIALWIVPTLEFFPLDMAAKAVKPAGGLERPFPDYWNYTLRDYGNRVGFARIFRALASRGLKASVAMSSRLAERYPHVLEEVNRLGFELIAHGIDINHIHATGVPPRLSGSGLGNVSPRCAGFRASRSKAGIRQPIRRPAIRSIWSPPRAATMFATGSTTTCPTRSTLTPDRCMPCRMPMRSATCNSSISTSTSRPNSSSRCWTISICSIGRRPVTEDALWRFRCGLGSAACRIVSLPSNKRSMAF